MGAEPIGSTPAPPHADPWGLRAEAAAAAGRPPAARPAARRPRRWAPDVRLRRLRRLAVAATTVVAALALSPVAAFAGHAQAPAGPAAIRPVALAGGISPLYDSYQVVSASTGGVLVHTIPRLGNGGLAQPGPAVSSLAAGTTRLVAVRPRARSAAYTVATTGSLAGSTLVYTETSDTSEAVWWEDIANGKSGTDAVPSGESVLAAAPGGWLLQKGDALVDHQQARNTNTTLATSSSGYGGLLAGPSGVAWTAYVGGADALEYVTYAAPHRVRQLTKESGDYYDCSSVTTDAVACLVEDTTTLVDTALRLPTTGGRSQSFVLGKRLVGLPTVVATPKVTAALICTDPLKTCALTRQPAAGGRVSSLVLPAVTSSDIAAAGDELYYGLVFDTSSAGGLYRVADTTNTRVRVVAPPRSPVAADTVSLSVGGGGAGTVAWIDNSRPGLGVWERSVGAGTGSLARSLVLGLGSPKLIGQTGFVTTDATSYGLSLADGGTSVAFSRYAKQPSKHPIGLALVTGGHTKVVATAVAAYPADLPAGGYAVDVSGADVLYQRSATAWSLVDTATGKVTALPARGIARYALGGGRLVWATTTGAVYSEAVGAAKGTEIAAPPSTTVYAVVGLAATADHTAWSFETGAGSLTEFVTTTSATVHTVPFSGPVTAISLSDQFVGAAIPATSGTTLYVAALGGGSPVLLTRDGSGLAVSGDVAAWVDPTNATPYAARI